jgi:hypothetical protein
MLSQPILAAYEKYSYGKDNDMSKENFQNDITQNLADNHPPIKHHNSRKYDQQKRKQIKMAEYTHSKHIRPGY